MTFVDLVNVRGVDTHYHKDDSTLVCPCRTREGFRDPVYHIEHPEAPVCNPNGFLPEINKIVDMTVKAFVQPARTGRFANRFLEIFGELRTDDHLGIFPVSWSGKRLDFDSFDDSGADYVEYNNLRFITVGSVLIPDPTSNAIMHHWELALRSISKEF